MQRILTFEPSTQPHLNYYKMHQYPLCPYAGGMPFGQQFAPYWKGKKTLTSVNTMNYAHCLKLELGSDRHTRLLGRREVKERY